MCRQKSWLDRLSAAARWRLGAKEAGEVLADYREIVGAPPRSEEELVRDLGRPRDAVKPLVDPKAYRLWLAVFAVMAAGIGLLGASPLPGGPYMIFMYCFEWYKLDRIVALLGVAGAIVWFRWKGYKTAKLPRAVLILLAVLVVWLAVILGANWALMHDLPGFAEMWGETPVYVLWVRFGPPGHTVSRSLSILGDALEWGGGLGMTVVGIFALVKARTEDRRWAAVYVLAMTAMLVCLETLALLSCMTITGEPTWESYFSSYFYSYIVLTAIGLMGTGVALC